VHLDDLQEAVRTLKSDGPTSDAPDSPDDLAALLTDVGITALNLSDDLLEGLLRKDDQNFHRNVGALKGFGLKINALLLSLVALTDRLGLDLEEMVHYGLNHARTALDAPDAPDAPDAAPDVSLSPPEASCAEET